MIRTRSNTLLMAAAVALLLVTAGLLVPGSVAMAQNSSLGWIMIHDTNGGADTLIFGNHTDATYCIDAALSESEAPPAPPGFSAVWISIQGRTNCFGPEGILKRDYRPFVEAKKDSFRIQFQNKNIEAQFAQVTLQWPSAEYLSTRCDSMFLVLSSAGGTVINMMTQSSVTLDNLYDPDSYATAPLHKFYIMKYGSHLVDTGTDPVLGVRETGHGIPEAFRLEQNYPNPFNPTTKIAFAIPGRATTDVAVYNLLGQKVATLLTGELNAGTYETEWNGLTDNGASAPSGVYFCRMNAGSFSAVRKMMLMK